MEYRQTKSKPSTPGVPIEIHQDMTPVVQAPVIIHVPESATKPGQDWSAWGIILLLCLLGSGGVSAYVSKKTSSDQVRAVEAFEKRIEKREVELRDLQRQVTRLETQMERVNR